MAPDMGDRPLEVLFQDALALHKNVAVNARLFCLMIFALDVAGWALYRGSLWALCGFVAALPVAASALIDQMPASNKRVWASRASYAIAALAAIGTLLSIVKV